MLLWALGSVLGCGVGQSDPSVVSDTQVVGAVFEPAQPAFGQTVRATVYAADPKDRGLELMAWTCTEYDGETCVELRGGTEAMVVVEEDHDDGVFVVSRTLPAELALLADGSETLVGVVWFLACEPGLCPIIDEARAALAAGPDEADDRADDLADKLADPVSWLRGLPMQGVSLAGRVLRVGGDPQRRNTNPRLDQRFLRDDDGSALSVGPDEALNLRFAVEDEDNDDATVIAYTTVGVFDERALDESSEGGVSHWLLAPSERQTGRVWLVAEDGSGGADVWTRDVEVR